MQFRRGSFRAFMIFLVAAGLVTAATAAQAQRNTGPEVPYVPTPHEVVRAMLQAAQVGASDVVYDLGSGDGRIVIAAVRDFGARRGVGVDIDPHRVRDGLRNAAAADVTDRTAFFEGDVLKYDFSGATVVTMYLLPDLMFRLRPRLLSELRPGTRIVSYAFHMADWRPDRSIDANGRNVFFWVVPARLRGYWQVDAGGEGYRLELGQSFQEVSGGLVRGGTRSALEDARLVGDHLTFAARVRGRMLAFDLRADTPERMTGTVRADGRSWPVTAALEK